MTLVAPWARNTLTMCRQAATNDGAVACRQPQKNQSVRLVPEAHNDLVLIAADGVGEPAQIASYRPSLIAASERRRVDVHQRRRAMLRRGRGETGLEGSPHEL